MKKRVLLIGINDYFVLNSLVCARQDAEALGIGPIQFQLQQLVGDEVGKSPCLVWFRSASIGLRLYSWLNWNALSVATRPVWAAP